MKKMIMVLAMGLLATAPSIADATTIPAPSGLSVNFLPMGSPMFMKTNQAIFEDFDGAGGKSWTAGNGNGPHPNKVIFNRGGSGAARPGAANNVPDEPTVLSQGNFLSVSPRNPFTITFSDYGFNKGLSVFSIAVGSLDDHNSVKLNFSNGGSQTFTGQELRGGWNTTPWVNGSQTNTGMNGRITFNLANTKEKMTSATFSADGIAFEADNFAGAVPEPGTWAMMIGGFGMAGAAVRRKRGRPALA